MPLAPPPHGLVGEGVRRRVESLPPEVMLLSFHGEIEATLAQLSELRKRGKIKHEAPREGLFVPSTMYFLNQWNEAGHPEYDFETSKSVYRDGGGNERSRAYLGLPINGAPPLPTPRSAP